MALLRERGLGLLELLAEGHLRLLERDLRALERLLRVDHRERQRVAARLRLGVEPAALLEHTLGHRAEIPDDAEPREDDEHVVGRIPLVPVEAVARRRLVVVVVTALIWALERLLLSMVLVVVVVVVVVLLLLLVLLLQLVVLLRALL